MSFQKLKRLQILLAVFAGLWFLTFPVAASDFTLVAVGSFGEKLDSCRIERFRPLNESGGMDSDYSGRFDGLTARNLPNGEYDVSVACLGGKVSAKVTVDEFNRFGVIAQDRRIMRSDHVVPELTIRMTDSLHDDETWWVSLTSIYGTVSYVAQFQGRGPTALIADPNPGSYLVTVLSTAGYACVQEIDLIERSRLWRFDPRSCRVVVDEFAHIVTSKDKKTGKRTGWYREVHDNDEALFRALQGAAKADQSRVIQPGPKIQP
jgi:hypothetical protein